MHSGHMPTAVDVTYIQQIDVQSTPGNMNVVYNKIIRSSMFVHKHPL